MIPGNIKVHEDFKQFAFDEANNNYLEGLKLLLTYKKVFDMVMYYNDRMDEFDVKLAGLRDMILRDRDEEDKQEDSGKPKTF